MSEPRILIDGLCFAEGPRFVDIGETAAEEALPRIEAALPWVRPE